MDPQQITEAARRGAPIYRATAFAYGKYEEMADPKVIYLTFDVLVPDSLHEITVDAPPVTLRLGGFDCELKDGKLQAKPIVDFSYFEEAEAAIRPYLDSWEAYADLCGQAPVVFFLRHYAYVNKATGPMAGPRNCVATMSDYVPLPDSREVTVHSEYPSAPPSDWRTFDVLTSARRRWRDIYHYRSSPAVEGYFLLSYIRALYGGEKKAAQALNVHKDVLRTLGTLSAAEDLLEGRKARKPHERERGRLTPREKEWIFEAGRAVMYRMACGQASLPAEKLTMSDLPDLGRPTDES